MSVDVSVVMPVLNPHPTYFRKAVASLLGQTLANFELIVVEDPSPASAGAVLGEFADPRIRHVRNRERTSFAAQINRGLELAASDLVARFDADDLCEPERLSKQVAFLRKHSDVDILGSHLAIIDTEGKTLGYREYPRDHRAILRAFPRYNPVPHPAVMYRKEGIVNVGGYHDTRFKGPEDYDLWSRLAKAGRRFATFPECLVRYRIHPNATKSEKLRDTIRGTLEVKERYWLDAMTLGGRARMWGERSLLWMPRWFVIRVFTATQFSSRDPSPRCG